MLVQRFGKRRFEDEAERGITVHYGPVLQEHASVMTLQRPRRRSPGPFQRLAAWVVAMLSPFILLQAQPPPANPAPLRVGISPIFPPMVFKQGKELAGVEVELARALGERLGRPIVFVEVPWNDQVESLIANKTDIIMSSMSITMARRHVVTFSRPYFIVGQMALVRREDLNKYALGFPFSLPGTPGVLRATTGDFLVQRDFPNNKRKVYATTTEAVSALQKKKIDLFVSDSTLVWHLAGRHATEGLAAVPIALSEEQLGWAMRKSDDTLQQSVNEFISKSIQDGSLLKVFRRWTATGQ